MADFDRWLGVELRHLAALRAVAEEGSFRGAAARLGYTQSAVSQQIATLERIVGATLIERRDGRPAGSLTDVGRVVLEHAEVIVARLRAAQADTDALASGAAGRLRVGTYQSVSEQILPALVPRFREAHPHVALELVESESDEDPLDQVRCGELDLTFALLPLPAGPFGFVELMRDAWMLLVPTDSPLAQRRAAVSLEEAVTLPLIGPRLDRCRMKSDIAERAFESQYLLRTDENGTVHELVAAGVGAGVIAHLAVDLRDERVSALPLEPGVPPRVIALAWHIDRRAQPPANTFIDLARELCAEVAVTELSSV